MKKTFRKHILREIRSELGRFLAIFAIVALGVGFLSGLLSTTPNMRVSADAYYDEQNLMDIRVLSTMGLNAQDVEAVRGTQGVEGAMGGKSADVLAETATGDTVVAGVHGVPLDSFGGEETGDLNRLVLTSGRWPESRGECIILREKVAMEGAAVGDELTLGMDDGTYGDLFSRSGFTIVGTARSPYYMSLDRDSASIGNGHVGMILYVPQENFAFDYFTDLYATVAGARDELCFSDGYRNTVDPVIQAIETLSETEKYVRRDELIDEAQRKLEDAKKEYEQGKVQAEQELADAQAKLDQGQREIDSNAQKLKKGRSSLADSRVDLANQKKTAGEQLAAKQKELDDGQAAWERGAATLEQTGKQLEQAKLQLDANSAQIEQLREMLESGLIEETEAVRAQIDAYDQSKAAYEQGALEYAKGKGELDAQKLLLDQGKTALEQARGELDVKLAQWQKKLDDTEKQLSEGEKKLETARTDLAAGQQAYETARAEAEERLFVAAQSIRDAEKQIADMEIPKWYVLDRNANVAYAGFEGDADKVQNVARVFPIFFFLVAALVVLTTMTRMVEEQRVQIGTLKALGYAAGQIASKYLLYAGAASLLGCIVGLSVGLRLFPTIIWNAYNILYDLPGLKLPMNWLYVSVSSLCMIAAALLSTGSAVRHSLREQPARLMLPRAPKAGKSIFLERIRPLWKRMKFTHKVTARNLFRYKKRFFMTVIGIAGCTALLLTGFGLRDAISAIVGKQFGDLAQYTFTATLKHDGDDRNDPRLRRLLQDERIEDYLATGQTAVKVRHGGVEKDAELVVPREEERLQEFIKLRERKSGEAVGLETGGVVLSEKMANQLGVRKGSTVELEDLDGTIVQARVTGVVENYVRSYVYMTPSLYLDLFARQPEYKALLGRGNNLDEDAQSNLAADLLNEQNVSSVAFNTDIQDTFSNMLHSIDSIVVVLIISAGALAFVVLYNLTNINVAEREKELATIKVLGFYNREVSAYVYRETAILTLLGTLAGLVLGVALTAFVVRTAEVDMVMFGRQIEPLSFVYAAALTVLFSLLVNAVMNRKIRSINMVESMKAPE